MDIDKIKVDLPKKKLNKMIHKEFRRQYVELLKEQEQEIEKLENIINKLEKRLNIYISEIGCPKNDIQNERLLLFTFILDYLELLKGSDK